MDTVIKKLDELIRPEMEKMEIMLDSIQWIDEKSNKTLKVILDKANGNDLDTIVEATNVINPIIGEYDDPDNQSQNVLTLPLSREGNTIIFGSAGNGKELMLAGIIYSSITLYNSNQVNFYILDFGAETLTMFR